MKTTNLMPKNLMSKATCSNITTPIENHLSILETSEPFLNDYVLDGFKWMFKDNDKYILHLDRLNKFRHYAADLLEQDPVLYDKLFPLFDTCNRIAGILMLNSSVHEFLPSPYKFKP